MTELGTNFERPKRPWQPWFTVTAIANGVLVQEHTLGPVGLGAIDLEKCRWAPDGAGAGLLIMQRIAEVAREQFLYDNPQTPVVAGDVGDLKDLRPGEVQQTQISQCVHEYVESPSLYHRCELDRGHPGPHKAHDGLQRFTW